ncbi:unnamed protein product, partial [Heterotrigona itama]
TLLFFSIHITGISSILGSRNFIVKNYDQINLFSRSISITEEETQFYINFIFILIFGHSEVYISIDLTPGFGL